MITNIQWEEGNSRNGIDYYMTSSFRYAVKTNPVLNCLNGGLITAFWLITQYLPVFTFAKSPRIIAPVCTITLPLRTMFCEPHKTVLRLTLFPDAFNERKKGVNRHYCKVITYLT